MNKDSVRLPLSKRKIKVHDKKLACPFCERLVSKFAEHIKVHKSEPTVAQMQNLTTNGSKERKSRIANMRKIGAFLHNMKVLRQGNGIFTVQRQSSTNQRTTMGWITDADQLAWVIIPGKPGRIIQRNVVTRMPESQSKLSILPLPLIKSWISVQ